MAFRWEYRTLDRFLLLAAATLVLLSILFAFTSSLVVDVNPDGSLSYAETYTTDDDVCVISGSIVFTLFLAVAGWWPYNRFLSLVKLLFFNLLWLFQALFLIAGIEQASIWLSLTLGHNVLLFLWLSTFVASMPSSWFLAVRQGIKAGASSVGAA